MTLATSNTSEPAETTLPAGHTVTTLPSANEKAIAAQLGVTAQPTTTTVTTQPKVSTDITNPGGVTQPAAKAPTPPPNSTGTVTQFPKSTGYTVNKQQPIQESVDPLLLSILSWPRKHDSKSEHKFCKWLRDTITQFGVKPEVGPFGNIIAEVKYSAVRKGEVLVSSTTLFSSHVDTIDDEGPPKGGTLQTFKKSLVYDPIFGEIMLDKGSVGGSLGADDGVGVWIMLKMIEAKVPGTYVFHRGEEVGGLGSSEMRDKKTAWLKANFETAIAFDRAHNYEVITHQGGQECASDKFGDALAAALNKEGMEYKTSRAGVFTDTKNYRKLIAECVNLGVGYDGQHHRSETLDYSHAFALMNAALKINWDALPIDRDHTKADPKYTSYGGYTNGRGSYAGYAGFGDDDGFGYGGDDLFAGDDRKFNSKKPAGGANVKKIAPPIPTSTGTLTEFDRLVGTTLEDLELWLTDDPAGGAISVAQLMLEIGRLRADRNALYDLSGLSDAT